MAGTDLRLGCAPDLPLQRLHSFLGALYDSAPEVQVEVVHLRTAEQLVRLEAGELDLGLLHDPGDPAVLEMVSVFRGERLSVVVPVDHLPGGRMATGPLRSQTLRLFPRAADPALHDRLLAALAAAGHTFARVLETGGTDIRDVLMAVAEGGGVALAAPSTLKVAGEIGEIVTCRPLEPPVWMPATMIAWSPRPAPGLEEPLRAARRAASELRDA